jgi:hypothetical protein
MRGGGFRPTSDGRLNRRRRERFDDPRQFDRFGIRLARELEPEDEDDEVGWGI